MKVNIKKLYKDSIAPTRAHETDAGWDLYCHSTSIDADGNIVYGIGVAFEIPKGHVGLIFPRSSNATKDLLLSNSVGVVDSGYRGEVTFKFKPSLVFEKADLAFVPDIIQKYHFGDRIGQIIIMPYPDIEFVEVDELSIGERGVNGYGSTGK